MIVTNTLGQCPNLIRVQMVNLNRSAGTAELRDELGRLFDRLGSVVVRPAASRHAASSRADYGRSGFTQRGGDAASGAPRRSGNQGNPPTQCRGVHRPIHATDYDSSKANSSRGHGAGGCRRPNRTSTSSHAKAQPAAPS